MEGGKKKVIFAIEDRHEWDRQEFLLKRTDRRDPSGEVAIDWKGLKDFKASFSTVFCSGKRPVNLWINYKRNTE